MTAELQSRWLRSQKPFDGVTLSTVSDEILQLPALRSVLATIVRHLEHAHPGSELHRLEDWHEHDGFLTGCLACAWEEVRSWLESDEALSAAVPDDDYVRLGVYPDGWDFYLRFHVAKDQHGRCDPCSGSFDLTCSEKLAQEITGRLHDAAQGVVRVTKAKTYFEKRYGG